MKQKHIGAETPKFTHLVPMPPIKEAKVESTELSLNDLAAQITARGNDMEVRSSKDWIKVFEVSKHLIGVITK